MSLFSKGFGSSAVPTATEAPMRGSLRNVLFTKANVVQEKITLDDQQSAIVNSTAQHILVVAAAGSGKTRVLTEKIRHLVIDEGVEPHNIVAITFTNMAAEEMRIRLSDIDTLGDAFIGTIHSFANHIMKESGERYTLFNDDIDIKLHKELIDKYCKFLTIDRYLEYKDLEYLVNSGRADESQLKSFFTPSESSDYLSLHFSAEMVEKDLKDDTHITFGESIATLCKARSIITFDELLVKAKKYFDSIKAKIEYVFVDEFQDVGTLEYNFIRALNADHNFFVGDDYQSLYGFKGGNVRIFKSLVSDESFTTYYLTNNYRNGSKILELAGMVISQVPDRIRKDVNPISKEPGEYRILQKRGVETVLADIKGSTEKDKYKNWFLLVRTNKELYTMVDLCKAHAIPFITFKREGMSLSELNTKMAANKIKILTVHVSKGLEADNVILYGNFPVSVPVYRRNDEERKVMYVGITRARKKLFVCN